MDARRSRDEGCSAPGCGGCSSLCASVAGEDDAALVAASARAFLLPPFALLLALVLLEGTLGALPALAIGAALAGLALATLPDAPIGEGGTSR